MDSENKSPDVLIVDDAWKVKSAAGRKPIFNSPEELMTACEEYLEWNAANPLYAVELVKFQGESKQAKVPKMRAMTIVGLCQFLDISRPTWSNYKENPEFFDTCSRVEDAIYRQKVEGAAADLLNAGFIGREIGLADKTEVKTVGEAITHIESEYVKP